VVTRGPIGFFSSIQMVKLKEDAPFTRKTEPRKKNQILIFWRYYYCWKNTKLEKGSYDCDRRYSLSKHAGPDICEYDTQTRFNILIGFYPPLAVNMSFCRYFIRLRHVKSWYTGWHRNRHSTVIPKQKQASPHFPEETFLKLYSIQKPRIHKTKLKNQA